jgi:hypothetical protein
MSRDILYNLVITYKNYNPLLDYFNCDTARTGIGPILGSAPCTDKKEKKIFLMFNYTDEDSAGLLRKKISSE